MDGPAPCPDAGGTQPEGTHVPLDTRSRPASPWRGFVTGAVTMLLAVMLVLGLFAAATLTTIG